ncbi:MAG: adenylate/guanylate cyclase domain-containing protein, partial [Merismopedia sp. SIO2A8]|nr:adenylate/guanylate cyclase domain-containing protein [Merismopedia sp. SIO2A8]
HNPDAIAEQFEDITILFADIVGFTPLSARLEPIELVNLLNQVFSRFDDLADELGLEKIKTIGDAYMVAAGLPVPQTDHAERIAKMALAMREAIAQFQEQLGEAVQIRIGINTGHVVAGVIGTKKFIYDLWGDAVNVASRMESSGEPGRIQVTANTYERLKDQFEFEHRGAIAVKGKGQMTTYWLVSQFHPPIHAPKRDENFGRPSVIESLSH